MLASGPRLNIRIKVSGGAADGLRMGMIASVAYVENPSTEPNTPVLEGPESARDDRVPPMRRLLSPVNAGVNAARHVFWFISYHAQGSQRPGR